MDFPYSLPYSPAGRTYLRASAASASATVFQTGESFHWESPVRNPADFAYADENFSLTASLSASEIPLADNASTAGFTQFFP